MLSDKLSTNKVSVVLEAIYRYFVMDNWLLSEC